MSEGLKYYFVHGFLRGTDCSVGTRLQKELKPHGIDLELIDARGGFSRFDCSVSTGVAALEALYEKHKKPLRLVAASMGGFTALIYSAKYPQNIEQLILLTCAVNLESVWNTIVGNLIPNIPPEETMKKWKEEGQIVFHGAGPEEVYPVSYNYVADSLTYPAYPLINFPVLSLVASKDSFIPLAFEYEWKQRQKNPDQVKLVEFDDDHLFFSDAAWQVITSAIVDYSK